MTAIFAQALSKTYPSGKEALKGLDLDIPEGEVFGFLGPNGAGKTTAVKLLSGILSPSAGHSRVLGMDPAANAPALHARCGVVTEHAQMYDHLTGRDNLRFYGELFGLTPEESKTRAGSLLRDFQLEEAADQKLAAYSTGMRQRLSLARALVHRPELLFLDEPTAGLDPESAMAANRMIRQLAKAESCTVFLCTHQLRYAEEVCSSYGLISKGRLLMIGTLAQLRQRVLPGMMVEIQASVRPEDERAVTISEGRYQVKVKGEEEIPPLVRAIVEAGGDVYRVSQERPSLEAIYFALTGGKEEGHERR